MFGIIFIIAGIIILLQALGYLGTIPAGIVWGVAFIAVGISIAIRRSARRQRRADWIAKHRERRQGQVKSDPSNSEK